MLSYMAVCTSFAVYVMSGMLLMDVVFIFIPAISPSLFPVLFCLDSQPALIGQDIVCI